MFTTSLFKLYMIVYYIIGVVGFIILLLFIPLRGKRYVKPVFTKHRDERDTMFSRNELKPGEKRYTEYYLDHPENREKDEKFRLRPGLLAEGTTYYNRLAFAAADASFEAVEAFFPMRKNDTKGEEKSGEVRERERVEGEKLSRFFKEWGVKIGAESVGIAEMKDYHFYTTAGRKERYGKPVVNDHKYGIAFTVEMDHKFTITGPQSPMVMESAHQYLNAGMIATQIALTLRKLGFDATTHIDANYDVICPIVAKDAGLGEIGRMGLLMTPRFGPRVRIAVVTTDAPLIADKPTQSDSVLDFCTVCKKCAMVCPSASIPHGEREELPGGLRWQINQESCFTYWCQAGTDCGKCIAVCPYSHKDNGLHRFVRWGIRNNFFFRRVAVKLDDLFYGKRPKAKKIPEYLD